MESVRFSFEKTKSDEMNSTWRDILTKRQNNRRYLYVEDPAMIVRGTLHQRYLGKRSMGLSMSLAAINWWNVFGEQTSFTEDDLDLIIRLGHIEHNDAWRYINESDINQGPALKVSYRHHPFSMLSNIGEDHTIPNWQLQVKLGQGNCMGDMGENLTDFLKSFSDRPFAVTVTIGAYTNAIFYNKLKEWIVFDSYGRLSYLDHRTTGVSAWCFHSPKAVEAFLAKIRRHKGLCKVSRPVFVPERVASSHSVRLQLSFSSSEADSIVVGSLSNPGITELDKYGDEDPYVSFMGGFGED